MNDAPAKLTESSKISRIISGLAIAQHGVVSRRDLRDRGISDSAIKSRIRMRQMTAQFRGVYYTGHAPMSEFARWMAATMACGDGAVISHHTAARLWGILDGSGIIHVARLSGRRRAPKGVYLHRPRNLHLAEVTRHREVPVTTVSRTLSDLAVRAPQKVLADAFSAARRLQLFDRDDCLKVIARTPGRPGADRLLSLIDRFEPLDAPSKSELQDRIIGMCLQAGLPQPELEVRIGSRVVDALWRKQRLILEADGKANHHHRFDEDRQRDLDHGADGYRTARVTYRMLRENPDGVVANIRRMLDEQP